MNELLDLLKTVYTTLFYVFLAYVVFWGFALTLIIRAVIKNPSGCAWFIYAIVALIVLLVGAVGSIPGITVALAVDIATLFFLMKRAKKGQDARLPAKAPSQTKALPSGRRRALPARTSRDENLELVRPKVEVLASGEPPVSLRNERGGPRRQNGRGLKTKRTVVVYEEEYGAEED